MSFSIGIVGLPNAGKSTLFKALTKKQVDIAAYPFTTLQPNHGIVVVPDERLETLAKITQPEKTTPTAIEFVDIAGLVKGAHKGEGLGNQFLANIRNCDAILEIVRAFENPEVEHVEGIIDPARDIEIIKIELLMKDLGSLEGLLSKFEKEVKTQDKTTVKKLELFKKIKEAVSQGKLILQLSLTEEEKEQIKEFQFLTAKPVIYLLNFNASYNGQSPIYRLGRYKLLRNFNKRGDPSPQFKEKLSAALLKLSPEALLIDLKFEEELAEFSGEEARQLRSGFGSPLESVIVSCYNTLDLITFFTIAGGKETRAWTIKRGASAILAGGKVHSDFEEKFIRAEVITCQKLAEAGSWLKARELGWIKTVGKEYIVEEGDVIEFKI